MNKLIIKTDEKTLTLRMQLFAINELRHDKRMLKDGFVFVDPTAKLKVLYNSTADTTITAKVFNI